MDKNHELSLEDCWSFPELYVPYLEKGGIHAEFKNKSDRVIEIKKISCQFKSNVLEHYSPSINTSVSIQPNKLERIQIPFIGDLSLSEGTITYGVTVNYKKEGSSKLITVKYDTPTRSIVVKPVRQTSKYFFISHKDPEDSKLATKLDFYLRKLGFEGYVAENDKRPGLDFWDDKIFPAIDYCLAIIVIWTLNATKDRKNIFLEVKYAKKKDRIIIPLTEKDVSIPRLFVNSKERTQISLDTIDIDLIKFVTSIETNYRESRYD